MYIFLALVITVLILFSLNMKLGIYKSSTRLINSDKFDEKAKWELITRWGTTGI